MTSLCYPYGAGITCVCDEPGRIYKCFPDLKSELASHASTKPRPNTASLADTLAGLDPDTVDRRSALVVTSTELSPEIQCTSNGKQVTPGPLCQETLSIQVFLSNFKLV